MCVVIALLWSGFSICIKDKSKPPTVIAESAPTQDTSGHVPKIFLAHPNREQNLGFPTASKRAVCGLAVCPWARDSAAYSAAKLPAYRITLRVP